jgi:pimeloyl-ACP methyl ester carboxylesterase
MDEQMTKPEILGRIHSERETLTEALKRGSAQQMTEPGVENQWSIKDILAHISAWESRMVQWTEESLRGEVPQRPASGMTWDDLDRLNEQIYQLNKDKPLEEVWAEFQRSHQEALEAVEALTESDLTDPQRFAWREGDPLWHMIAANTWWHYQEHGEAIQAWLDVPHSDPARVEANGVELVYDTFGEPSAPPLLLIMGLGAQMIAWDEGFCRQLAMRGYRVIRFDNRDVGLSTWFDAAGVPDITALFQAGTQGRAVQIPYTLDDMADDAVGLLDSLGIASAHVVGASMGGMIAQLVAIHYPHRVRTLTSIMSTTGDPALPPPTPEAMTLLLAPPPADREGYLDSAIQATAVLNGPGFPVDVPQARERAARAFDRGLNPAGTARQLAAVVTAENRRQALQAVTIPTLVIHGEADPLVPIAGGRDTANAVPGARLLVIEGLGHALPPATWTQVVDAIAEHAT